MTLSTIREILVQSAEQFGQGDAVRYKAGKDQIETKSYVQLKQDSESFSLALMDLGEQGAHVAVTGMTSYPWLVTYLGTVNCGCVAVPLDVSLPAEEMCELISRADVTSVVLDEIRMAKNIQLFKLEMILMVPLMIETLAKKREDAAALPPQLVKQQVFGEQFHTICSGGAYLTGRKKNLIITKNGENVSPEELENKLGEDRLVQEILVRENEGVIEAEIFPDLEYAAKKGIEDLQAALQERIDAYNRTAPAHKRVYRLKVRNTEFEKTPSKKIKRY